MKPSETEGLHSKEGVEYLAKSDGWIGGNLPSVVILGEKFGFEETTAFVRACKGTGFYLTSMSECSCPDWKYRRHTKGEMCKHQIKLCEALRDKKLLEIYQSEHIGNDYVERELSFPVWSKMYKKLESVEDQLSNMNWDSPNYWEMEAESSRLCAALGY